MFPGEVFQAPRHWVKPGVPQLIYYNEVDRAGHFAFVGRTRALRQRDARGIQVNALTNARGRRATPRVAHGRVVVLRSSDWTLPPVVT